jgi:hypothetical protein
VVLRSTKLPGGVDAYRAVGRLKTPLAELLQNAPESNSADGVFRERLPETLENQFEAAEPLQELAVKSPVVCLEFCLFKHAFAYPKPELSAID